MGDIVFDITRRADSTEYEYGELVAPATLNGHVYKCTTPGTSGTSVPSWNTGAGSTTTDGAVEWTEANPSGITYSAPLTFQTPPKYEDTPRKRKYSQVIEYAAGGEPYVFTHEAPARQTRELSWSDMVKDDWAGLSDFIDILRGAIYAFVFTDEDGNTHDALILNSDDIRSAAAKDGLVGSVSVQLLLLT